MATGGGIGIHHIQTAVTQMNDNARVIIRDGEVVEGKTYNTKATRWLHQTSKSNQEIWGALKTALGGTYDSSILSRVMPEDAIDTSKPLTARTAKEIMRQADELKKRSIIDSLSGRPQVTVGSRVFYKPDEAGLRKMLTDAENLRELIYAKGSLANMTPEEAHQLMKQMTDARRAIVDYFGFNHQILPEETSKSQEQLEKDSGAYPLASLPPGDADMVVALRGMIDETHTLLGGKNQTTHLLNQARALQTRVSNQGGGLTPKDVQQMIGQIANAKQTIVRIFQKNGLLPTDLNPGELLNKQGEIDDLDVKQLPSEDRKQAGALRDLITENTRLLNTHADIKNPHVTIYAPTGHLEKTELENAYLGSGTELQNRLNRIIPDELRSGDGKKALSGNDAKRAMDRIAYNFDQLLKHNPDIRLAFGILTDIQRQTRLVGMLNESRLKTGDSSQLRNRLLENIPAHVPDETTVTKGKTLGQGSFGKVSEGLFNGKKVVVKELVSTASSFIENVQSLIQEGSIQGRSHDDPNIPKIIGIYTDSSDVPHVVMELVPGRDLQNVLAGTAGSRDTQSRAKVGLHLMSGIVRGLEAMHSRNMVHLDLKPGNVMMNQNSLEPKLIDFGMATPPDDLPTDKLCGTALYISPEIIDDTQKPHFGSDIYALGTMLYETVNGGLPDKLNAAATVWNVLGIIATENPGGFSEPCWKENGMDKIKALITACWERDPVDRPTANQLLQAFNGETVTPSGSGQSGLKEGQISVLDVLKPDSPLRQGGRDLLTGWVQ